MGDSGFLARWARRLSWREVAETFQVSWEAVYRSVEWFVAWGLAHRQLKGVESIGVDEIHWGRGLRAINFLTVIYQIDAHCRRLLYVGKGRSKRTLLQGLKVLGPAVVESQCGTFSSRRLAPFGFLFGNRNSIETGATAAFQPSTNFGTPSGHKSCEQSGFFHHAEPGRGRTLQFPTSRNLGHKFCEQLIFLAGS
jgi:hypothetical protein